MPNPDTATPTAAVPPARTHAEAAELLRRPFAPGAIGFRAMSKVSLNGAALRRRAGRRVPERPVGRAAPQRRRARPLAPGVRARRARAGRRRRPQASTSPAG